MPDGGYPRILILRIDVDHALVVEGDELQVVKRVVNPKAHGGLDFQILSILTKEQVSALLFHFSEWSSGLRRLAQRDMSYQGERVQPQFRSVGCAYEY